MPGTGDDFRRRRSGDPPPRTTTWYNGVSDLYNWWQKQKLNIGTEDGLPFPDPGLVLIKNASGSNLAQFGVLGIDAPLVDQATNDNTFRDRVVLSGSTPGTGHSGKLAIAAVPIPNGKIGPAVVMGAVQVKINILTSGDGYADVSAGSIDHLESRAGTGSKILWAASGTGVQWGIVLVNSPQEPTPRPLYSVKQAINSNADVAYDGPRFQ